MLKYKSELVLCYPCVRRFKSLGQNGYRTDKLEQSLYKSFRTFHSSGRGMSHAKAKGAKKATSAEGMGEGEGGGGGTLISSQEI